MDADGVRRHLEQRHISTVEVAPHALLPDLLMVCVQGSSGRREAAIAAVGELDGVVGTVRSPVSPTVFGVHLTPAGAYVAPARIPRQLR
jgi:hypothetical protein